MPYISFKNHLIEEFETRRDMLVVQESANRPESLFGIKDKNDRLYMRILDEFERAAIRNVENLVAYLCGNKSVAFYRDGQGNCSFDLALDVNGVMTAVEFKGQPNFMNADMRERFIRRLQKEEMPVMMVFLLKESIESRTAVNRFMNSVGTAVAGQLEVLLFEDFLEKVFGRKEKQAFQDSMVNFKNEMHQAIGYQVTELCSPYNLDKLKTELDKELLQFDYDGIKQKRFAELQAAGGSGRDLSANEYGIMKNVFLNHGRYKLLLGNGDFAESLVTAEWLNKKYFALEELDNTFIVAGYLKSIEQLLWDIIFLVGQGRDIKGVTIDQAHEGEIDKTLGALQFFLSSWSNDDLFMNAFGNGKHFVMRYLKKQISDWRMEYRNGYFHKHNLKDIEKINAIREETYFLYLLILGTVKLSPTELSRLS